MKQTVYQQALRLHAKHHGKIALQSKVPLITRHDLSLAYTPGVAEPCRVISKDSRLAYTYTSKGNTVAVVSDGSAVLGLGNIGANAAIPVMEGKCVLFKRFAGIDAWPLCLDTQDPDEIVAVVKAIAPAFGGVNLEDISAPRCFDIEARLQNIGIPVMHDDQHGTAVVIRAGLANALRVAKKRLSGTTIVISGAGAAGTALVRLLTGTGEYAGHVSEVPQNIIVCDTEGAIYAGRKNNMNPIKQALAKATNHDRFSGTLREALVGSHIFIGVSGPNLVTKEMVAGMAPRPIIFAMANPTPEILPGEARAGGAAIVGTGRSDFPNQINNVLAYPGIFRGALDARAERITPAMKLAAIQALSSCVARPTPDRILPGPLEPGIAKKVSQAVRKAA